MSPKAFARPLLLLLMMAITTKGLLRGLSGVRFGALFAGQSLRAVSSSPSTDFRLNHPNEIQFKAEQSSDFNGDLILIPYLKPDDSKSSPVVVSDAAKTLLGETLLSELLTETADLDGKVVIRLHNHNGLKAKYVGLISIGASASPASASQTLAKQISTMASSVNAQSVGVFMKDKTDSQAFRTLINSIYKLQYTDFRFKKSPENPKLLLKEVTFLGVNLEVISIVDALNNFGKIVNTGVVLARDLVGKKENTIKLLLLLYCKLYSSI
jgi:leucyl aminopeptidase